MDSPERSHAKMVAEKVLDRPSGDPDDDLAVLARQFLRSQEELNKLKDAIKTIFKD